MRPPTKKEKVGHGSEPDTDNEDMNREQIMGILNTPPNLFLNEPQIRGRQFRGKR